MGLLSAMPPPTLSVLPHMTLLPLSTTGSEATLPTPLPRLMLSLRSSPKSLPRPTPWLRPLTPTSHPQLAPSSLPLSSRPITSPSQSSRTSPPMEPSTLPDQSVPTRLSTSQSFTRPGPTPSRPCPRLLLPQSTLSIRSQLPLTLLPQLPMPLMLLPQLPTPELPTLDLPMVPTPMVLMLLPQLPLLLPQPSLPKQCPKFSSVPKSERGLYRLCAVSDFLRHTKLYNRRVGVSWWLFLVSLRIASNVSNALQYDVTTSITSGLFSLLNVLYSRYRRELFINKTVLFL